MHEVKIFHWRVILWLNGKIFNIIWKSSSHWYHCFALSTGHMSLRPLAGLPVNNSALKGATSRVPASPAMRILLLHCEDCQQTFTQLGEQTQQKLCSPGPLWVPDLYHSSSVSYYFKHALSNWPTHLWVPIFLSS